MEQLSFFPIWADSLGAKSMCTLVKTPEVSVLIDPGAAVMQPSFPASWARKLYWLARAEHAIRRAAKGVKVVVISHYHYDHFTDFDPGLYKDRLILAKNPNEYINDSQRGRAESFFDSYCRAFAGRGLQDFLQPPQEKDYPNPLEEIPEAATKDFGDYNKRRRELLRSGLKWFNNRVRRWSNASQIPEFDFGKNKVCFPEGREFRFSRTKLRFTRPLFHGIEFSRVGWVFATVIEREDEKLLHSSDLSGIYIEDYAELLIQENPQVLILDGPPTYMGFMLIKRNLERCLENTCEVIKQCSNLQLLVYDHHLLRERGYRRRTERVWETGRRKGVRVLTVAEYLGKNPVIGAR